MASWITSLLAFLWPSRYNSDIDNDVDVSKKLLKPLSLRSSTRAFTFALRDPSKAQSVVYILPVVILSEQSARDAEDLIKTVKPDAVIVQVGSDALEAIQIEHHHALNPLNLGIYPTTALHVIKESFYEAGNHWKYMKMAQADVLKALFGTTFTGYVLAARRAANDVKSSFYFLESPPSLAEKEELHDYDGSNPVPVHSAKNIASLLGSSVFFQPGLKALSLSIDSPGIKFIALHVKTSADKALRAASITAGYDKQKDNAEGIAYNANAVAHGTIYECPTFAKAFYPFLADMYDVFQDLPGMDCAFEKTQKLLKDVEKGNPVDAYELSLCQCFRLAAEGLRIALCKAAHSPLRSDKSKVSTIQFDDLSYEDKCHVLLVQALRQKAKESERVVAILDAGSLAGVRKYWSFPVPDDVIRMAEECLVVHLDDDTQIIDDECKSKTRVLGKPIIMVGAAAVGVASLSHFAAPVSTAIKILTFKIPLIVKLLMLQTKKGTIVAMSKIITPVTNFFVPYTKGMGVIKFASGSKASVLKAMGSTGKVRGAAHSVIASAERATFSAIRTSFYNAMRNQQKKGVRGKPWVSFGASVAACIGLFTYGEGIENVVEIIPEASSISRLCRGVNNLCHASNSLRQFEDPKYWENTYNQLYSQ